MTTQDLGGRVRDLLAGGRLDLEPLGGGRTSDRWRQLSALARHDLSEGRIAEAHVDAVQILAETGRRPSPGCLYGVWASEHPRWTTTAASTDPSGASRSTRLMLDGTKAFCTGTAIVDRALVTVRATTSGGSHGPSSDALASRAPTLLVDLAVDQLEEWRIDAAGWTTDALADTATAVIDLTGIEIDRAQVIGGPDWYLDRPGFWDGAIGPAACWAGGALGLVDHAVAHPPRDPHGRAHLGALTALAWSLTSTLDQAGRQIDATSAEPTVDPDGGARRQRALVVRHLVDRACAEIQDRFARALGPRPLASEPAVHRLDHALSLYRRQCHAERDLEALGDLAADGDH